MKRIFARALGFFLAMMLILSTFSYAFEPQISISRTLVGNEAVQKLVVKGNLSVYEKGERVTLKVYKKSLGDSVLFGDYTQLEEVYANEDGSFEFSVEFDAEPDTYTVLASSLKEQGKGEMYIPALTAAEEFIEALNNGEYTAAEAANKILTDYAELAFDISIFKEISSDAGKTSVLSSMMGEISTFDIENLYESFARYTLINALNFADDAADVSDALGYYNEKYLNLESMSVEALKKEFNKTRLDFAYNLMKGQGFSDISGIKGRYTEAMILSAYKNADAYLNIYDVLNDYQREIGISDKIAQLLPETTSGKTVLRYLVDIKNTIDTLTELKEQIIYALANLSLISGADSTAPSGGGSGGGGGGGEHISVDPDYGKTETDKDTSGNFEANPGLSDASEVPWAEAAIKELFSKGIVSGKGNGLYKPNDTVTRAEMTKMLVESVGAYDKNAVSEFSDAKAHWSNSYVASAFNKGYIYGVSADMFGVNKNITRQDVAVIVYRIIQVSAKAEKIPDVLKTYSDLNTASDYAINSIKMLGEYGIMNGFTDGSFKPKASLTRAEAAVVISNFLKYMEEGL